VPSSFAAFSKTVIEVTVVNMQPELSMLAARGASVGSTRFDDSPYFVLNNRLQRFLKVSQRVVDVFIRSQACSIFTTLLART